MKMNSKLRLKEKEHSRKAPAQRNVCYYVHGKCNDIDEKQKITSKVHKT